MKLAYLVICACAAELFWSSAWAINKCTGADGVVSYQQATCSTAEKSSTVEIKSSASTRSPADVQWQVRLNSAIAGSKIIVGMTPAHATTSWGSPTRVNRSISASGSKEQWVYDRGGYVTQYIHFTNGLVTSVN